MMKRELITLATQNYFDDVALYVSQQLDLGLAVDFSQDMIDKKELLARNAIMTKRLANADFRQIVIKLLTDNIIARYACNYKTYGYNSTNQKAVFMNSIMRDLDSEQIVRRAQIVIEEYDKVMKNKKSRKVAR